jgi:type IV pilus assembly protein PilE
MKKSMAGFTLTEIMIVVVIVGVLAAIALPSYQSYVQKTRRSDAIAALEKAAARQEQFYFQYNQYTDNESRLGGGADSIPSPEGYYIVTSALVDGGQGYTLTATPVAGGVQAGDSDCAQLTLNHLGQRGASPAENADLCWGR